MLVKFGASLSLIFLKDVPSSKKKRSEPLLFLPDTVPLHEIYKDPKILKPSDYISLQYALLVNYCLDDELPKSLLDYFKIVNIQHQYATHPSTENSIFIDSINTEPYGKNSVKYQFAKT